MHPSHPTSWRALARSLAIAFGALLLITCGEEAIAPRIPRIAQLSVEPIIPAGARTGGLVLDSVAIRVARTDGSTVTRFAKRFPVDSAQLSLTSPQFLLSGLSEDFDVTVDLFAGGVLLFSGTSRVTVGAAIGSPPFQVPVSYQGPGLQVASVQIQPRDTMLTAGAVVAFRVTALDSLAVPVTQFYVGWSSTASPEIVDASGTVTAPALRDTVFLRVQTPTGIADSTRIILLPQPTQLLKSGGDNQTGGTGAALAQPLAVQVRASDNLPVPGVVVGFAATTGGGSVDSATATTDAQGIARSGATLGATVGAQSFTATAPGLAPVVFSATATSVSVPRTWNGSVSAAWTTAGNWTPAGVPAAIDTVVIVAGTPNDPDLTGNASIAALTLQGTNAALFVTGNLTVAGRVSLPDTNSFIEFTTGQLTAGDVSLAGFQAFIDATGGSAVVSGPVLLSGNSAFFQTGPGSALGATTLSGAAAFVEHAGGTQGPLTVSGSSAFWEAGGAVTVTGTPAIQVSGTGFLGGFSTPVSVTVNGDVSIGGTAGFLTTRTADRWTINGNLLTTGGGTLVMTQPGDTIEVNGNVTFNGGDESLKLTAGGLKVAGNFSQTGTATSFAASGTHSVFLDGAAAQAVNFQTPGFSQSRFQNVIVANTAGAVQVTSDIYTSGTAGVVTGVPRVLSGSGNTLFTTILNVHNFTLNNLLLDFTGSTVVTFDSVTFQNYAATATPLRVTHPGSAGALTFDHISFQVVPTTGFYLDATDSNPTDGVPLTIDVTNGAPAAGAPFIQTAGGAVVNWPPAAPVKTWTGAVSTDWSVAGNWSPAGAPGATDDVTIGSGPVNQPSLTANAAANSIIIAGLGARLTIAGHSFTVGSLVTHTDGLLVMTNAADLVVVTGAAAFQGGDETGLLSAGELRVAGDFTQQDQTNTHSFFASGTHRTVMTGAALQTVTFCCTLGASGFQELDLSATVGINIQFAGNGVFVYDTLISQVGAGAAPLLYTLGKTLTAARLRVDKLIVDRGTLILNEGGVAANEQLDNVTFQNFLTTFTQLQVVAPGGAGVPRTLTFNNLIFQPLTTGNTGRYLNVSAPSGTLIVDLPGASPAGGNGPTFTTTSGAVTVNWPAAPPFTWTGAVSTNWGTAGNWSGGAVPTNADDVIIPSGPANQPVVSTSCSAKSLTVNAGATLNLAGIGCQVQGSVFADGPISATATLQMQGTGSLRGTVPSLIVSGAVTAVGTTSIVGPLTLTGATGVFTVNGNTVNVSSSLATQSSALLVMTNPADLVTVGAGVSFNGANELGSLSAGVLQIGGNFNQFAATSADAFHSSGSHLTIFTGASPSITFATPGNVPGTSHFEQFRWTGAGTLTLGSDVFAHGFMDGGPGVTGTITSASHTLQVGSFVSGGVIFNATSLVLDQPLGAPIALTDVTFNGMAPTANQLTVNHPGTGGPFSFTNLTFSNAPTTGFYLVANDVDGATNGLLTLDLVNPAPATSGGFSQVTNGAVINWPASTPVKTWTGAATSDWQTTTNWSPVGLPTATDDVIIPATANNPVMSAAASVRSLTVQTGVLLNLNSFSLNVNGDLSAPAATSFIGGGGALNLLGTGRTLGGTLSSALPVAISGSYTLAGRTVVGGLTIFSTGSLDASGNTLVVGGALTTSNSGVFSMTNPLDSVLVTGAGTFGGGDETGRLTAGYLKIGGSFGQTSVTSGASFAASGTHRTEMGAGAVRIINFATPGSGAGTSHFNDFIVNGAAGGISLAANTFVNGQLVSHPTGATPVIGVVAAVKVLTVGGVDVSALGVDQNVMTIGAGTITQFDNVAFTGQANGVTQLTIANAGAATPFTFTALSFGVTPTTGLYLAANDIDGASPNALTINLAGASPAAPSPSLFSATGGAVVNWPPAAPALTWNGSTSTDWHAAANWTPAQVPTPLTDVTIPAGTPNAPVISTSADARDLSVAAGTSVDLQSGLLTVSGNVLASGPVGPVVATGVLRLTGTGKTLQGSIGRTEIFGGASYTLAGPLSVNDDLTLSGALTVGGQTLVVANNLLVFGSGTLVMQNPADVVFVTNQATFGGGASAGLLTAGLLEIQGKLLQTNSNADNSFSASGAHLTRLSGAAFQQVDFITPGSGAALSHFANLDVSAHTAGLVDFVRLNTMVVEGTLISLPATGTPQLATSNGGSLSVGSVNVNGLVVSNLPILIGSGPITSFSQVTFSGFQGDEVQLTVTHPGTPAPITLNALTFQDVPTTGLYLRATDTDGPSPDVLALELTNPSPASDGGFSQAQNGAVITWPTNPNLHTWTGAVDNSWENPLNWTNGGGPGVTGDAVIPAGPPMPVVGSNHQINSLTVQPGAAVDLNGHTLTMNNGVDAQSGIVSSGVAGGFIGTFFGPIRGDFVNVSVEIGLGGSAAPLNGLVNITGAGNTVFISGDVTLAGNTINNPLGVVKTTNGAGRLIMTGAGDLVQADSMDWSGGDETGLLTAGVVQTRSLSQGFGAGSTTTSFFGSGNHQVILSSSTPSTIALANPGSSRFQDLNVSTNASATLSLGSNVTVAGALIANGSVGPARTITGSGVTLTAGGANISAISGLAIVFDGVPLVLSGGTIGSFNDVEFDNQSPVGTALTVNNVGQGTPFTFANLTFTTSLTAGGFHLVANDLDGATPDALVIDVAGASPATGAGVSQATNGAVIHWPPTGSLFTWTGSANTDWSNPGNWDLGAVPGVLDDVVVVPITNQPILSASGGIHGLTIQAGATLDVDTTILVIGGDLANDGNLTGVVGTGGVTLVGTGGQARGAIGVDVVIPGSYTLNGGLTVQSLSIAGASGSLTLNGNQVITTAGFSTLNNGVVDMTSANDQLSVGTDALFAGGNETGRLTAGFLQIAGDFSQFNLSSPASFVASGTLLSQLNGLNPTVTFTDPGTSHFQDLTWGGIGGTLQMGSDITVLGTYNSPDGTSNMAGNGHAFTATVFFSNGLNVDNMPIILDQQAGGSMNLFGITFTNMPTNATQVTIRSPGQAGGVSFSSMVFSPLTTGDTGFYIDAVDTDGASPDILTITVDHDPSPAGGPTRGAAHTNTDAVSVVNWQP